MSTVTVGELIREWRVRRRRSQLDLSIEVGVSTRHLSFVETGKAKPSPELVLALAQHLDVPLRERNQFLLAAGYAPRYGERSLDAHEMTAVRVSIQTMLDAHDPYPGIVIDRASDVVLTNTAALGLLHGVDPAALTPTLNVYRLTLHPGGLARSLVNFVQVATYALRQLRRSIVLTGDARLEQLHAEVMTYPDVRQLAAGLDASESSAVFDEPQLLVPFRMSTPDGELSMFTTLTTFGTARDITLDELTVELFWPSDERSASMLRRTRHDDSATATAPA